MTAGAQAGRLPRGLIQRLPPLLSSIIRFPFVTYDPRDSRATR
jgi:hypothetical protein